MESLYLINYHVQAPCPDIKAHLNKEENVQANTGAHALHHKVVEGAAVPLHRHPAETAEPISALRSCVVRRIVVYRGLFRSMYLPGYDERSLGFPSFCLIGC